METEKILKSSQEQAVGAWINYLNQVRLDRLSEALVKQNENLETAIKTLDTAFATIKNNIILRNRGGEKGMHGFIAEIAECGIGNARKQIIGKAEDYETVWKEAKKTTVPLGWGGRFIEAGVPMLLLYLFEGEKWKRA